MTDLPLNVVSMCTAMLDGNERVVSCTDGTQTWRARRIRNGFQFVLINDTADDGIENVPLPFPSP